MVEHNLTFVELYYSFCLSPTKTIGILSALLLLIFPSLEPFLMKDLIKSQKGTVNGRVLG